MRQAQRSSHLGPNEEALTGMVERYDAVRTQTEALCRPLQLEDYVVSSMTDVSPTKWHLAHTSWFFETFVLSPHDPAYRSPDPRYAFLFNSYYLQAGERHCRAQRGLVTRPTVEDVLSYRRHVDSAMRELFAGLTADHPALELFELGLHHEQQHQELLLTDIKHVFWTNPLRPTYQTVQARESVSEPLQWLEVAEGVHYVGHGSDGFAYDNELPRHRVFTEKFRIGSRLVTNAEYLAFMEDGGYTRSELWLSNAWSVVQEFAWDSPLYWERTEGGWTEFTLRGTRRIDANAPVCHVSYYEADAFARWAGKRLPTEFEWEIATGMAPVNGQFVESARFHPEPASERQAEENDAPLQQLYGDVWQWTQSPYTAYPGYSPAAGAIGEYNGKWMCDQWVLRGASCATPRSHARKTYRNFFPASARWQFAGIRLAEKL